MSKAADAGSGFEGRVGDWADLDRACFGGWAMAEPVGAHGGAMAGRPQGGRGRRTGVGSGGPSRGEMASDSGRDQLLLSGQSLFFQG